MTKNTTFPVFPIGQTIITANAMHTLTEASSEVEATIKISQVINRHRSGDFGTVDSEDWNSNMRAVRDGDRILSEYDIDGIKVWVITEWDRSITTVLLPEDY